MSRRGRHRGASPLPLVREAVAAALAPVATVTVEAIEFMRSAAVPVPAATWPLSPDIDPAAAEAILGPLATVEDEPAHFHFTDSKTAIRYTLDHVRGTGTVMLAREDGLCERTVTYDSQHWFCACGVSGRVARSDDGIPYVDDEVLAHEPGDRS